MKEGLVEFIAHRVTSSESPSDAATRINRTGSVWLYVGTFAVLVCPWINWGDSRAISQRLEEIIVPFYTYLVLVYVSIVALEAPISYVSSIVAKGSEVAASSSRPREHAHHDNNESRLPEQLEQPATSDGGGTAEDEQPFDLSGAYKLISNDNFEGFLAVQGVPWALRRAANQARPIHRITHRGNQLTIKIEGIIESQTTYVINGPPVETNVRGRIFEDKVTYLPNGQTGIICSKRALTEQYDVTVQRVLSEDKSQISLTSRAIFRDDRAPVQSIQIFRRAE